MSVSASSRHFSHCTAFGLEKSRTAEYPFHHLQCTAPLRRPDENSLIPRLTVFQRIRRYIRTDPYHNLISHPVKLLYHLLRMRKLSAVKSPVSIAFRPAIVNHQNSGRHPAFQNPSGICENILLILMISKLDPCIVNNSPKQIFRRHSPKWKMLLHGMQIGLPKAASCLFQLTGIRDLYNAASDPDVKSLLRPEASPFVDTRRGIS